MRNWLVAAACAMGLAACATQQSVEEVGQSGGSIPGNSAVYVSVPDDGRYGDTTYTGSGENTAQVITGAFASRVKRADQGRNFANQAEAMEAAQAADADYLVVPQITHWEDRATEWSGIPDQIEVLMSVYNTENGSLIDKARIEGTSSWWTLGGDEPQDLLDKPVRDYVDGLVRG